MALTPKQQRFVEEYLVDLNATAAAERAGYRQPNKQGPRLLVNVGIAAAITAAQTRQQQRTNITADKVLHEYARVAFSDLGDVLDFSGDEPRLRPANEIPEDARRAVASVKVRRYTEGSGDDAREVEITEFRLWPKLEALEKLAARFLPPAPQPTQKLDITSGGKALDPHVTAARFGGMAFSVADAPATGSGPAAEEPSRNGHHEPLDSRNGS